MYDGKFSSYIALMLDSETIDSFSIKISSDMVQYQMKITDLLYINALILMLAFLQK